MYRTDSMKASVRYGVVSTARNALNETLVRRDLLERTPGLSEMLTRDILVYAMAGAGLDFDAAKDLLNNASEAHLCEVKTLFHKWRNGRNPREFYQTMFEAYGYTCEDMLQRCKYADEVLPCCEIFRSTYVALRGRCFMLPGFHQHRPNYHGDLKVTFKQLPSWLLHRDGVQPEIVVYLTAPGTVPSPYVRQYRLRKTTENYFALKLRRFKLLDNDQCISAEKWSRTNCYYDTWVRQRLLRPLNCTLFYLRRGVAGYNVCDPDVVVNRYGLITNETLDMSKCLPACKRQRREVMHEQRKLDRVTKDRRVSAAKSAFATLTIRYTHLEYENYEEVLATSASTFVSELGGQSSLFIGASLPTALQMSIVVVVYAYTKIKSFC
ncbi:Protein DEL-7 [Aphelenchoides avenae]|nr:Protein DEL-7 [Aphelenchus avenae]